MLKETLINKLNSVAETLEIKPSRCLRMRLSTNTCSKCQKNCFFDALRISEETLQVDEDKCTGCLLCSSSCISGAIAPKNFDIFFLIKDLREVNYPVLGCSLTADKAHAKVSCLGLLTEEHFIAFYTLFKPKTTINLTACFKCNGEVIIKSLSLKLNSASNKSGLKLSDKIRLETDLKALDFKPSVMNRRGFFETIKNLTFFSVSELFISNQEPLDSYATKFLPPTRRLLNGILPHLQKESQKRILYHYYNDFVVTDECIDCQSCIGLCPTGALELKDEKVYFNTFLCIGCRLCEEFCVKKLSPLKQGYRANGANTIQSIPLMDANLV